MKWLSPLPLWTGILAGPVAWALDLSISYALVKWTCANQRQTMLQAMTSLALVCVAGGAALSFIALRSTAGDTPTDGGEPRQRARFMAILGLASCALFALAIVAGAIPRWVLDACQ
jgi:NAD/NADP transhydrogenase alpha subunit